MQKRDCKIPETDIEIRKMGMREPAKPSRPSAAMRHKPALEATSLADALFSMTQRRVLALLFGQPERSFFTTEIIGLVGAGSGAVRREIRRLVESALVMVARIGNQKHCQANLSSPIYEELRGIVVKTLGSAEVLRGALVPLGDKVRLALVYGSIAKRKDTAYSDIDLLIVPDIPALELVYEPLALAEQQLGRRVSPTLYAGAEFHHRRESGHPFLTKVLAGDTVLLVGDDDELLAAR